MPSCTYSSPPYDTNGTGQPCASTQSLHGCRPSLKSAEEGRGPVGVNRGRRPGLRPGKARAGHVDPEAERVHGSGGERAVELGRWGWQGVLAGLRMWCWGNL